MEKLEKRHHFLYDPLYKYKTTIAGQIFICMWLEQICTQLNNVEIIQGEH